jgi:hypothetical protein
LQTGNLNPPSIMKIKKPLNYLKGLGKIVSDREGIPCLTASCRQGTSTLLQF